MSDYIVDHFKRTSHASFFYPYNLKNTAREMIKYSFDLHHKIYSNWDSASGGGSTKLASDEEKVADALTRLSAHARIFTATEVSSDMPVGQKRPIEIAHFDQELLEGVLACGTMVYLDEYPHLRTVFGEHRRLPRTAYLMPALEVSYYAGDFDHQQLTDFPL